MLLDVERHNAAADEALHEAVRRDPLDARDRALAQEIVYGVLRHQLTLDWRLDQVATKPMAKLPANVRATLRLGAYQLLYLDRIPSSAAVNESVSLVKTGRMPGYWPGFVNAVLRALTRAGAPAWPDQMIDPIASLSVRYSCPAWLVERWITRFGIEQASVLCRATATIPPLTIRANTLRTSREHLIARLTELGYPAQPTTISPVGAVLDKCGSIEDIPLFREGLFYVEDEAAQLIAPLLDPQPGERILDACAAPGGKTTQLAALMQNRGEIIALDRSADRLRMVDENCRRLGISIVHTIRADVTQPLPATGHGPFDRILVDAPCSGLGVLRRHPEGKWRKDASILTQHQLMQRQVLDQVCRRLRAGGVLVYSTCSSEPEENERVIDQFCQAHRDFHRESVAPWLPPSGSSLVTAQGDLSTMLNDRSMDLFFAARLRKAS